MPNKQRSIKNLEQAMIKIYELEDDNKELALENEQLLREREVMIENLSAYKNSYKTSEADKRIIENSMWEYSKSRGHK